MKQTSVIFCSDVHLCHLEWYGRTSEQRMDDLVDRLNRRCRETSCEKIVFLGDYSLDHWAWQVKGSWLARGVSETARFCTHYAARLNTPFYMLPGNHEQYGNEHWRQITGMDRQSFFVVGGYLIICCDNYAGLLDPQTHSDGVYSPTDLDFVRTALAAHPGLPAILCAHSFDRDREPDAFYSFLKGERRITLLVCGHDHLADIVDLGERADHVCVVHDGHYSYAGGKRSPEQLMWGFCQAILTEDGVDMRYVEPEQELCLESGPYYHPYREQNHRFFPRRDR